MNPYSEMELLKLKIIAKSCLSQNSEDFSRSEIINLIDALIMNISNENNPYLKEFHKVIEDIQSQELSYEEESDQIREAYKKYDPKVLGYEEETRELIIKLEKLLKEKEEKQ